MKKKILLTVFLILVCSALLAYTPLDRAEVNPFDRTLMAPYNKTLDRSATVIDAVLAATPVITAVSGEKRVGTVAVMYAETMAAAWGTKELLKYAVHRSRPYLYFDNPPEDKKDDWEKSFPSGHTTMAFAAAAFTSYTFNRYNPESSWHIPVTVGVYALAATTAALRIASGSHFLSDVLAGAAIGTVIGFGIPWLHTLSSDVEVGASPFSLLFSISF